MPVRGLILLVFFIASLPVCFFRPFYGVLLWMVVAFLNPHQYTWSAADAIPWAMVVAVPTLAGLVVFNRDWRNLALPHLFLLFILWVWFTTTSYLSSEAQMFEHHSAQTWYQWKTVSKMLLMTAVTAVLLSSFSRLANLILVVAGCFGLLVAKGFPFIIMTGGNFRLYGPPKSMIEDNNDYGLALNMTLPLFLLLARTHSNKYVRRIFGFLVFAVIPSILCTYSRGAMVGLVVILVVLFLQSKDRLVLIPVIGATLLLAVVFAPESWKQRMMPTEENVVDSSAMARFNSWHYAWNLASDYPLTGGGFETFTPPLFARYAPNGSVIFGPHSIYFEVLAEHGFPGLFLYLIVIASAILSAWRLKREARMRGSPEIEEYANMLRLSLIGFMTSGVFLGRAYFDYFFMIVVCIAALGRIAREQWAQEEDSESSLLPGQSDEELLLAGEA